MDVQPRPRSSSKSLKISIFTLAAGHLKSPGRRPDPWAEWRIGWRFRRTGTPIMSLTHSAVLRRQAAGPAIAREWLAHAVGFAPSADLAGAPPTPGCGMPYVCQRRHLALLCGPSTSSSGVPHDEGESLAESFHFSSSAMPLCCPMTTRTTTSDSRWKIRKRSVVTRHGCNSDTECRAVNVILAGPD